MNKFTELASSRRFWIAAISTGIALWLFFSGRISSDQLSVWVETALGVYGGSIGLEHAAKTWTANTPKEVIEEARQLPMDAVESVSQSLKEGEK